MDANSWLINSDNSNASDVISALLEHFQIDIPALQGLTINNPGRDYYNVNGRKIKELKELYFNYRLPQFTKRDIHALHQTYGKYQLSIHQLRLEVANRDSLLRDDQLLTNPNVSDVLNPQISDITLSSGDKVYGVNPMTGICYKEPLEYEHEVRYDLFQGTGLVVRSPVSGCLDLARRLKNLLSSAEEYGFSKTQLSTLLLLFTKSELGSFYSVIQKQTDCDIIFDQLANLCNTGQEVEQIRTQLNLVYRNPGDSLASVAYKIQALHLELSTAERPMESAGEKRRKAENFTKRVLPNFVSERVNYEMRALKKAKDRRGETLTLEDFLSFASQLESSGEKEDSLRSVKNMPKDEVNALCFNNELKLNHFGSRW